MKKSIIFLSAFAVLTIANIPYFNSIEGLNSQIVSEKFSFANSGGGPGCYDPEIWKNTYLIDQCTQFIEIHLGCNDGSAVTSCTSELGYAYYDICANPHVLLDQGSLVLGTYTCIGL
jgi:hypothetical protein